MYFLLLFKKNSCFQLVLKLGGGATIARGTSKQITLNFVNFFILFFFFIFLHLTSFKAVS